MGHLIPLIDSVLAENNVLWGKNKNPKETGPAGEDGKSISPTLYELQKLLGLSFTNPFINLLGIRIIHAPKV
jgi:hypothetical protein